MPIAADAELKNGEILLEGLVAEPDGSRVLRRSVRGDVGESAESGAERARKLGEGLARELLEAGARGILERLYAEEKAEGHS